MKLLVAIGVVSAIGQVFIDRDLPMWHQIAGFWPGDLLLDVATQHHLMTFGGPFWSWILLATGVNAAFNSLIAYGILKGIRRLRAPRANVLS